MSITVFTFDDGSTVEPTESGVRAVEMLVRQGRGLNEAVRHIAGSPRMFQPEYEHTLLWVCTDCVMKLANDDTSGCPDDKVPTLLQKVEGADLTIGMLTCEHAESCPVFYGGITGPEFQCDCDRIEFSKQPCDGCGETLAGFRHAVTMWTRK